MKNVKPLQQPTALEFDISITQTQEFYNFSYFSFEVNEGVQLIATGSFIVAIKL